MTETLAALIGAQDGALPALGAPGRDWMDYDALRTLAGEVAGRSTPRASGAATGWRSCCRTGRRWRRPS
jgi:hypothetical protein